MTTPYESLQTYRTLETIRKKVQDLVCDGAHDDTGLAYQDLLDFVEKECRARAIRIAREKAEAHRRHPSQSKRAADAS